MAARLAPAALLCTASAGGGFGATQDGRRLLLGREVREAGGNGRGGEVGRGGEGGGKTLALRRDRVPPTRHEQEPCPSFLGRIYERL